jgi:hypothetical protein
MTQSESTREYAYASLPIQASDTDIELDAIGGGTDEPPHSGREIPLGWPGARSESALKGKWRRVVSSVREFRDMNAGLLLVVLSQMFLSSVSVVLL